MIIEPKISPSRLSRYYTNLEPMLARAEVKAYTMLILSLFTIAFFGFFAIRPTVTTIAQLRRQISDSKMVDQKLQEKINALSEAQIAYEAIKPDLEILTLALPSKAQFPSFVKGLEKISTESGAVITSLNFQTINLSAPEANNSSQEIPIDFTLSTSGDYSQLADFIKKLSFLERLAIIEKVDLSLQQEKLHLTLKGKTFYVQ